MILARRFAAEPGGGVRVLLPDEERALLRTLPGQLRAELADPDDPGLRRLFPPAYADDREAEEDYRRLTGDELADGKLAAIEAVERTIDADVLAEEEAHHWLGVLNDLRLVLGTRLDVTEETFDRELDPRDPRTPQLALYSYLSWLQESLVAALVPR